jgi:hypothetical protein
MHDWETRLTTRDNNRVVRPFEFGSEWTAEWPQAHDVAAPADDSAAEQENFF